MHSRKFFIVLALLFVLTLGIAGIMATPASADGPVVHVVGWGDTLLTIAARYGTSVNALAQANNLRNTNFIWIGQRLTIPGTTSGRIPPSSSSTYVVQSGDTLFSIATRYGTTVSALMQMNGLYNYWIYVGQTLRIPGQPIPPVIPPPSPSGIYYVVRPGDYLSLIAERYGTTAYALQIANRLYNPSFIWVGQRLFIPGAVRTVSVPAASASPTNPAIYPTVIPYTPPTATPYVAPATRVPTATPNPNATVWEAVLITNTTSGPCYVGAFVIGKSNWPVVIASTDGSYISEPKYTGNKPDRGEYYVEFANSCTGTWRVIPLGLNIFADVQLNSGHAEIEFHPRQ